MRAAQLFAAVLVALTACQADSRPRYVSEQDHLSIIALEGWTQTRNRDSLVFAGDADDGLDKNTIVIRSVPRVSNDWVQERTAERVIPATQQVLQALPGATVKGPTPVERGRFQGATFELSFEPRSKDRRYERTHVVLVGTDYVYHVIHTAPEGDLHYTAPTFDAVVDSLREEA